MVVCEYKAVVVAEYAFMVDNKMLGEKAVTDWQIPFLYSWSCLLRSYQPISVGSC
jgi:hypothetical protein